MRHLCIVIILLLPVHLIAQEAWDVWQCMEYAVANSHGVHRSELQLDNYNSAQIQAIGDFLPSVGAGIGAQFNFGRAIDPETNAYTNVSTLNNGYSLSTSFSIFEGLARIHALQSAKANRGYGKHNLAVVRERKRLATFQAFVTVLYQQGRVELAEEKLQESTILLRQTNRMKDLGRRSAVDVAQIESERAADEYLLIQERINLSRNLMALKHEMNYPVSDTLILSHQAENLCAEISVPIARSTSAGHPEVVSQLYLRESARHQWKIAQSALIPSLSINAGVGTNYNLALQAPRTKGWGKQFVDNAGQYVGFTLSIPIFNRLNTLTNIRRAKNNYLSACEDYEEKRREIQQLTTEAVCDFQDYVAESEHLKRKVASDSTTLSLIQQKYDEGLATFIDIQTARTTLHNSRVNLLRSRLMAIYSLQLIHYYCDGEIQIRRK